MRSANLVQIVFVAGVLAFAGAAKAQPSPNSYACIPSSCLLISPGTGTFYSGMQINGYFVSPYVKTRIAQAYIQATDCTMNVEIDSVGMLSTYSPVFGTGVVANAKGSQGGVQLLEVDEVAYFAGGNSRVVPLQVVPCS
jgi:hypothetical protein